MFILKWLTTYLTRYRNSVDKRTVIENYDLVVRTNGHNFRVLLWLMFTVSRRR
jgi:hypothetical protein